LEGAVGGGGGGGPIDTPAVPRFIKLRYLLWPVQIILDDTGPLFYLMTVGCDCPVGSFIVLP